MIFSFPGQLSIMLRPCCNRNLAPVCSLKTISIRSKVFQSNSCGIIFTDDGSLESYRDRELWLFCSIMQPNRFYLLFRIFIQDFCIFQDHLTHKEQLFGISSWPVRIGSFICRYLHQIGLFYQLLLSTHSVFTLLRCGDRFLFGCTFL